MLRERLSVIKIEIIMNYPETSKMSVNTEPFSKSMTTATPKRTDQRKKRLKFKWMWVISIEKDFAAKYEQSKILRVILSPQR